MEGAADKSNNWETLHRWVLAECHLMSGMMQMMMKVMTMVKVVTTMVMVKVVTMMTVRMMMMMMRMMMMPNLPSDSDPSEGLPCSPSVNNLRTAAEPVLVLVLVLASFSQL